MKKFFIVILLILFVFTFDYKLFNESVYNMYDKYFKTHNLKIVNNENKLNENKYHNEILSSYIKETDNLDVSNKQELMDVYFTAVNRGYNYLTFYCLNSYYNCMNDINELNSEDNSFSHTNQLVNVFNSFSSIESTYLSNKRVDIKINKKYNEDDINKIDDKINKIINELNINDYENEVDKIKLFHDYIADTNTYDEDMANNKNSIYKSDTAIGTLFEGKSICSGYADTLSIFLDKLNITNVRIASKNHVWNALKLDNTWYHIDLTWDDPIVSDGSNVILDDYFMITTDELEKKNEKDHSFDKNIYSFIK